MHESNINIVDATSEVTRGVGLLRLMPLRGSFFSSEGPDALRLRDESWEEGREDFKVDNDDLDASE